MAMNDEERLQFAVAQELAAYTQERGPVTEYWGDAQSFIAQLRGRGITLTPPPAPEPTYTRTFTETQWGFLIGALDKHPEGSPRMPDGRLLVSHMDEQKPDPEPGA